MAIEFTDFFDRGRIEYAFEFAQRQVRILIERDPDFFPMFTENGRWRHDRKSWTNWCEGFLPGMMWMFAGRTGDPYWRDRAEHYSQLIEDRKHDPDVHDLGFLFWSTWKRWYNLDLEPVLRDVVVAAGQTMGLRFNENGRYLRSFVAPESTFIDIMMNVGIMMYAALETGDDDLMQRAIDHCDTTRRFLVRGDGSTTHEGIFDLETGAFLRQSTHQGWRADSSWARGQAWSLYGFGTAYRFTNEARFLRTAEQCADFFIERTRADGVPPNDWEEPDPPRPYESSAAAIAASGLMQLSELTKDSDRRARYLGAARTIVNTLVSTSFLADEFPEWEGILLHGEYHASNGLGLDESVMWGEYFFVEALDKALGGPYQGP